MGRREVVALAIGATYAVIGTASRCPSSLRRLAALANGRGQHRRRTGSARGSSSYFWRDESPPKRGLMAGALPNDN